MTLCEPRITRVPETLNLAHLQDESLWDSLIPPGLSLYIQVLEDAKVLALQFALNLLQLLRLVVRFYSRLTVHGRLTIKITTHPRRYSTRILPVIVPIAWLHLFGQRGYILSKPLLLLNILLDGL